MPVEASVSSGVINSSFNSYSYEEMAGKIMADFGFKLKLSEKTEHEENSQVLHEEEKLQQGEDDRSDDEEEQDEEEFSFAFLNPDGSPISADDIFQDGRIRPVFPLFDQDLLFAHNENAGNSESKSSTGLRPPLKKLLIEESESASEMEGPCCAWKGKAVEVTPEVCKKSNSTGFSKLWGFRDLLHRSSSDGKNVFVFFNHSNHNQNLNMSTTTTSNNKAEKSEKVVSEKKTSDQKKGKKNRATSVHEKHYVRNRAKKEEEKRKSYLPYKQIGFFTNVNGLSRNVHPF